MTRRTLERVTVYLRDGRVIDVSGLTVKEAITHLKGLGVGRGDIVRTVHVIPRESVDLSKRTDSAPASPLSKDDRDGGARYEAAHDDGEG